MRIRLLKPLFTHLCVAFLCLSIASFSAGYAQQQESELTVEERLERLEEQLARLETRVAGRVLADSNADARMRIDRLERQVSTLSAELSRLQRQTEAAAREAADARREARNAQTIARQR